MLSARMKISVDSRPPTVARCREKIRGLLEVGSPDGDTYYDKLEQQALHTMGLPVGPRTAATLIAEAIAELVEPLSNYKEMINNDELPEIARSVAVQMAEIANRPDFRSNPTRWADRASLLLECPERQLEVPAGLW